MVFGADQPLGEDTRRLQHLYAKRTVRCKMQKVWRSTAYICPIAPLFREDMAQCFAAHLAQVALPELGVAAKEVW